MLDGDGFGAGALGSDWAGDRVGGLDGEALPGVSGVVDVGEVMVGDLDALLLGVEGPGREIEGAKKS